MDIATPPPSENPPSEADSTIDLSTTTAKLKAIVDRQLDRLMSGEIPQLSSQTALLMDRLVSIASATSSNGSVNHATQPIVQPIVPPLSFAQVVATPKTTVLTTGDVRRLPRLNGSADVDVAAVLSQYRLVAGFKAKSVRPNDETYGDSLAFEFLSLICDDSVLTLYQQLSTGTIDWRVAGASSEASNVVGEFAPPENWAELSSALLDLLMPSNSVEEYALKLACFKQGATESVTDYTLRLRTLTNRFESAVERQTQGRRPWAAFSVTLFQHGLIPSIQCLQLSDKPVTSLREAVDRARRHEAASLAGGTVSALSFTPVPNRAAASQYQQSGGNNQRGKDRNTHAKAGRGPRSGRGGRGGGGRGGGGRGGGGRGGRGRGGGSSSGGGQGAGSSSGGSSSDGSNRPTCTFATCRQPIGHTVDKCYQKAREQKERDEATASKRARKDKTNNQDDDEEEP